MKEIVFEFYKSGNKNLTLLNTLSNLVAEIAAKYGVVLHLKIIPNPKAVQVAAISKTPGFRLNEVIAFVQLNELIEKLKKFQPVKQAETKKVVADVEDTPEPETSLPTEQQALESKTKNELAEMFDLPKSMSKRDMLAKIAEMNG